MVSKNLPSDLKTSQTETASAWAGLLGHLKTAGAPRQVLLTQRVQPVSFVCLLSLAIASAPIALHRP